MSMTFDVYFGSGRARCKLCDQKIETDEIQVKVDAWYSAGSVHFSCLKDLVDSFVFHRTS